MNMISRTALSNFRKNKSRNLLIGAAIALTTFLLTAVPTAIFGFITIQSEAVNRYYPTFHAMFRNADRQTAQKLLEDAQRQFSLYFPDYLRSPQGSPTE